MAAQILSFATAARLREPASRDWSQQELAEFYRVESALLQAGLQLEGERGLSDEGDPWFVFCRTDTGEVFIHFARVDGGYIVDGAAFGAPARGRDFAALVRELMASHPLAAVRRPGSNVMLHPAALLIALVGAAFFHSGKAHAAEPETGAAAPAAEAPRTEGRRPFVFNVGGAAPPADAGPVNALDAGEVAAVLTGVAIGLREAAAAETLPDAATIAPAAVDLGRAGGVRDRAADPAAPPAAGSPPAGDVHAALAALAVSHDLAFSVAATGHDQTAAVLASQADVGRLPEAVGATSETVTPAAAPSTPLLLVRLASARPPQGEAVALVTADAALAHVAPDHVTHVDALPALILTLISDGDVVTLAPPTTDPTSSDTGVQVGGGGGGSGGPPPTASGSGPSAGAGVAAGNVVAARASDPLTAPHTPFLENHGIAASTEAATPAHVVPGATPTTPAAPVTAPPLTVAVIDGAVDAFLAEAPGAQILISGHDVVVYDPAIFSALPAGVALDSITWKLNDGSSVSLVGTAPELHAFHGLG